jgi:hypothetical protein
MNEAKQKEHIQYLDLVQATLEADIFNYALEETIDLYDEEKDEIIRAMRWSVGTSNYGVVVTPLGFLKDIFQSSEEDDGEDGYFPCDLILQITNSIQDLTHRCYAEDKQSTQNKR